MKDKEVFGLLKIPDEVVIKQLRQDLGKANAYIQELEHLIKQNDSGLKRRLRDLENENKSLRGNLKALQGDEMHKRYTENIKKKSKEIESLRNTISELVCRLNKNNNVI